MKSIFISLSLFFSCFISVCALAQSCGSGGGAEVCLSATGTTNSINLSWTVTGNIDAVQIYRDTDNNPNGRARIAILSAGDRSFSDSTPVQGTQYWYWVKFRAGGRFYNSGAATASLASPCNATPITPYISAAGVWTQTSAISINAGTQIAFGPQPASGGAWSWSGCGTSGSSREQYITPSASCSAQAIYTNSCGATTTQTFTVTVTATGSSMWKSSKFGGGGYVTGLIFHPNTQDLLYARTDIGGAYRWNPATTSWVPITDGVEFGEAESRFHGIESIALDPNNDQLVYMATGMYTFEGNGRLYISSDRGDHWSHVDLPFALGGNNGGRAIGERLAVDPNKPSILFFGSRQAGLWKSADSGLTWAQVTSLSPVVVDGSGPGVGVVVFDTSTKGTGTATQTIYVAIEPDYVDAAGLTSSLYRSTDGGASWAAISAPVTGSYIPHMVRADDGMLYVAFTGSAGPGASGPGSLYKFDGTNWTLLKNESMGFGGLSVQGSGATTRIALGVVSWGNYAGQQIVQLSENGGTTWREIEAQNSGKVSSGWVDDVEINPFNLDNIMHVHGGGILETQNASSNNPVWGDKVDNLEETAIQTLVTPPPGASYTVINASGDVGIWVYTDLTTAPTRDAGLGWSNGFSADMSWSDPNYIAGIGVINASGVPTGYWSGDGGLTWAFFNSVPASTQANAFGQNSTVVTSRNNVVTAPANSPASYTTNNGASWTETNLPGLPSVASGWSRTYHLAADRQNPNKVYAYDSGGATWSGLPGKVYVSTDAGHSFTLSQGSVSAGMTPNSYGTTSMAVNPYVEGDLWVADSNTVFHSVDSGATWTKLANFASANDVSGASLIALGKAAPGASYSAAVYVVGTIDGQWGIYRSDDEGATWTRFNDDDHQFGGIGVIAADWNIYGRVYLNGTGRGMLYSN